MANQGLPAPAVSFPFVDEHGYLTVSAVQFLQPLAQAAQGLSGPLGDDSLFSGQLDRIRSVSSASSAWTPTVAGATTAGAQTYGTQWGAQVDIGPVRLALFSIVMSALDGTTAGAVQIAGFPVPSSPSAVLCAGWLGQWRATLSASYTTLGLAMTEGLSVAALVQSGSGVAPLALPTSGLGATSAFTGGVLFVR